MALEDIATDDDGKRGAEGDRGRQVGKHLQPSNTSGVSICVSVRTLPLVRDRCGSFFDCWRMTKNEKGVDRNALSYPVWSQRRVG